MLQISNKQIVNPTTVYVLFVILLATLVRSAFGFGESLVAVPLLALRIPLPVAAPLSVLVSVTVAAVVIMQDWKKVHGYSAGWLILSTLFGIPPGLLLLTRVNEQALKVGLSTVMMAFSIYALTGRSPVRLKTDKLSWMIGCGFCAGVLGGAYGLNGPSLAIYGSMRRWSAQHFRATLHGYFLPANMIGMIGFWIAGLCTARVTHYYLISLPLVMPAIFVGRFLNHRLRDESFFKYIYLGLLVISIFFLIRSLQG